MAISVPSDVSYEEFYRSHEEVFSLFLRRTLGREREGAGGRIGVADTLQDAMVQIHAQWPALQKVHGDERDQRLYRCLRDAAGEALRHEHGRLEGLGRPRVVAFDFGLLHTSDAEGVAGEKELAAAVLGVMAADVAASVQVSERRGVLDRAVLLAGLRALSEREVVVLLAIDHLEWEQEDLAEHLKLDFGALRTVLFEARRVFYGVVRHAAGIELDEEERARLHAYQAGELSGRERRVARRHLQHCDACQAYTRELRRFGEAGQLVLAPLPFLLGARALSRSSSTKATGAGVGGAGGGLFGQVGAAKALGLTVGLLGAGVGIAGVLAEGSDHVDDRPVSVQATGSSVAVRLGTLPARPATTSVATRSTRARVPASKRRAHSTRKRATSVTKTRTTARAPITAVRTVVPAAPTPAPTPASAAPSAPATRKSSGGGEFFGQ